MRALFVIAMLLAGCSERSSPPPAPAPRLVEEPVVEEPVEEPIPEEQQEPPALTDEELEQMDQPALEAACYAGSSAACDRLGH